MQGRSQTFFEEEAQIRQGFPSGGQGAKLPVVEHFRPLKVKNMMKMSFLRDDSVKNVSFYIYNTSNDRDKAKTQIKKLSSTQFDMLYFVFIECQFLQHLRIEFSYHNSYVMPWLAATTQTSLKKGFEKRIILLED